MSSAERPASRRSLTADALKRLAPRIPPFDREAVLDHAQDSPGLAKGSPEAAAWLSLLAHIRHLHTEYDSLLADGYDADSARYFVRDAMNQVLDDWGCRKKIES